MQILELSLIFNFSQVKAEIWTKTHKVYNKQNVPFSKTHPLYHMDWAFIVTWETRKYESKSPFAVRCTVIILYLKIEHRQMRRKKTHELFAALRMQHREHILNVTQM